MDTALPLSFPLPAPPSTLKPKTKPFRPPPQFSPSDDGHPPTPAQPHCPSKPSATPTPRSPSITPLQRRHLLHAIARRSAGPRKRRRSAPPVENGLLSDRHVTDAQTSTRPSPNAHSSPETMDVCPPPLLPPPKHAFHQQSLNGSFDYLASPHRKQLYHRSLWPQIASAHHYLTGHPRTDPRFISNRRPLDCLEYLRASIAVTLLPDGYVRHDSTSSTLELPPSSPMATIQSPSPDVSTSSRQPSPSPNKPNSNSKNHNITTLPRYPYDRNSKQFLRCLDLGIIPPPEDLPEMSQRYYYDGCLIAEINDLRYSTTSKSPPSNVTRVLLRPDMSSLYHDLQQETASLDPSVACAVERIILNAISSSLNLHPRPQLTSYTRDCAVQKLTHPLNIIRKPRTRTVRRPPGFALVPRTTAASALLLISAADKQQTQMRHMSLTMRAMASELSAVATKQSSYINSAPNPTSAPHPPASRSKSEPVVANGIKPGESHVANNNNPHKRARPWRFAIPTAKLLQRANQVALKSDKAVGISSQPVVQQQQHLIGFMLPERVRTVRFIMPDPDIAADYTRAKTLCEHAVKLGGHVFEKAKSELAVQHAKVNKGGMPEMFVQLLRSVDGSLEIIYVWSAHGDKDRDYYRTVVANVAEGHILINQVKSIVGKEGYVCAQDISQEEMLQIQKQKRMNQNRQANSGLHANAQHPQVPRPAYTPKQLQEQLANGVSAQLVGDVRKNPGADAVQLQGRETQSKPRSLKDGQKQMQISQQMLKRKQQQQQQQQQHHQEQIRRQQQHQILKEQIQRGHLQQFIQHQQPTSRGRVPVTQMGRIDKNGMNIHRPGGSLTNQIQAMVSKGLGQAGSNAQISQGLIDSMGLRNANISNLGMSSTAPHSQMFQPQQLQQLQQQLRQQQLQQQQRSLMGHVNHPSNSYGRGANLNAFVAHNLQSRGVPGAWSTAPGFGGNAATDGGRGVAAKSIVGANGVNAQRLPTQFTSENIDHSAVGKR
eukprot:TRINITY_DN63004_c0_g1_i1.p1 TRINITY_DN63004_c0_g1~~TRINITY_DN63004_c0_g1_i1.p1  ORF type:complete len:1017 (-),score=140.50 TRINITY_DN63004_c0_g1_i1:2289-5279(-)